MKKVLIVEDDPFIRDITTIKLSEHGYSVTATQNGELALEALKTDIPDIILLDLDLPNISGFDVLTHIKQNPKCSNVHTIIFSNNSDTEIRQKVSALGIAGFFVKASTEYAELYRLIDSL
jgi:CheY-like chemotaxis protein